MTTTLKRISQGGLEEHLTTFADPRSGLLVRPDDTTYPTRPGVSLAASISRFSLTIESTRLPSRSMAR